MIKSTRKILSQQRGDTAILIALLMGGLLVSGAFVASLGPAQSKRALEAVKKKQTLTDLNYAALEMTKTLLTSGAIDKTTWQYQGMVPNGVAGNIYCNSVTPTAQTWETGVAPTCQSPTASLFKRFGMTPVFASIGQAVIEVWNYFSSSAWAHGEEGSSSKPNSNSNKGVTNTVSELLRNLFGGSSTSVGSSSSGDTTGDTSGDGGGTSTAPVIDPYPGFETNKPTLLLNLPTPGNTGTGTAYVKFLASTATSSDVSVTTIVPSGTHWAQATIVARIGQSEVIDPKWSPDTCVFRQALVVKYHGNTYTAPDTYRSCPANYAVVTTSNGASLSFVCCQLPSADILTGPIVSRSEACNANELMVGSSSSDRNNASVDCQGINTAKYRLGSAKTSCVWGSGSGGWAGASGCGTAPLIVGAKSPSGNVSAVGGDGCTGSPFGSFLVSRRSQECGDQSYSALQTLDGTRVDIKYP